MKHLLLLVSFFAICNASFAQDRILAYTYQTNVLKKGDFDLEFQNTLATGKQGAYSPFLFGQHLNQRLEFEFGLGKNVQTSFYLNSELFSFADTASTDITHEHHVSFSNEWKWKLSDPVANGIGSALYAELEFGGSNFEFEGKVILDKQIRRDLFALNIVGKYEIEKEITRENNVSKATWVHNSPVEFYFGYMHQFNPRFSLGLEAKNNNDITQNEGWMNSVLFAGPAFHVSIKKCFVLFTAMPQIVNIHKTIYAPGDRDLNDFEASEFRIIMDYSF